MKIKSYLPYITSSKKFYSLPPYARNFFLSLCATIEYNKVSYEDVLNIKTNKIHQIGSYWKDKMSKAIQKLVSEGYLEYSKGDKIGWHNFRIVLIKKG